MTNIRHLLETARLAAFEAGKAILEVYHSGDFAITMKTGNTPLTKADKMAHQVITRFLKPTRLPVLSEEGINIDYSKRRSWKYCWLVDPLDGTKEFISRNGEFTVNIALVKRNKPVGGVIYVPCTDVLYCGSHETGVYKIEKGKLTQFEPLPERQKFEELVQREHLLVVASRSHLTPETRSFIERLKQPSLISMGSSLKFMLLLEKRACIYPRSGVTMEWDTAAAHAILNASNRGVYQADLQSELIYNKADLKNPSFIAF